MRAAIDLPVVDADPVEAARRARIWNVTTAWSRTSPSNTLRKRIAGRPEPAKAMPSRQHSQVLSSAILALVNVPPASSDQAKASAAPG